VRSRKYVIMWVSSGWRAHRASLEKLVGLPLLHCTLCLDNSLHAAGLTVNPLKRYCAMPYGYRNKMVVKTCPQICFSGGPLDGRALSKIRASTILLAPLECTSDTCWSPGNVLKTVYSLTILIQIRHYLQGLKPNYEATLIPILAPNLWIYLFRTQEYTVLQRHRAEMSRDCE